MPKVSCASKDAVEVSLGIQEGVIEITKAVVRVHQYPPNRKTGEQGDPFPCVQITAVCCDKNGERTSDDEIKEELALGSLDKFHPGKASGPDDNDPEDQGYEVDSEGNCIYATEDGARLNKRCKWIILADSLEQHGFKPEVLGNGYMPDLVGLKCEVKTEAGYKIPGRTYQKDPTHLVVTRILQFPYDKKKAKAGAGAKAASKPAAAASATAAPAAPAASGEEGIALNMLTAVADEYAGQGDIERKKLQTAVQTKMMRGKVPINMHKPVLALVKDDEWLGRVTTEQEDSPVFGRIVVDFQAGTVAFAEKG